MAIKVKRILVPYGTVTALAERFDVSDATVRAALRFGSTSEAQTAIRQAAVEEYGGKLSETVIPE